MPTYAGGSRVSKRVRSRSRAPSRSTRSRISSSNIRPTSKTWPYQKPGYSYLWDPFPAQATAILRYSTVVTLNPGIATPASWLFRANSIFDPDFTGVGHQPYGHDTYQSIYNHYAVTSSIISVQPSSAYNGIFGISLTDDSTVNSNYDTIRETKGTVMSAMQTNSLIPKLYQKYNRQAMFGNIQNVNAQSANFGANPAEQSMFHVWAEGSDDLSDPGDIKLMVSISYIVRMWELKDLGQS